MDSTGSNLLTFGTKLLLYVYENETIVFSRQISHPKQVNPEPATNPAPRQGEGRRRGAQDNCKKFSREI